MKRIYEEKGGEKLRGKEMSLIPGEELVL